MLFISDALFWSAVVCFGLGLIHLAFRTRYQSADLISVGICTVVAFLFSVLFVWIILYKAQPALVGPLHGMWFLLLPIFIEVLLLALADVIASEIAQGEVSIGVGWLVGLLAMFVIVMFFASVNCVPRDASQGFYLASLLNVTKEDPQTYPDTDANHIVQVPEDTARFKASQVVAKGTIKVPGKQNDVILSTVYQPGKLELQSVQNHLYWIAPLDFLSWRNWNQVNQESPGYIVVDAEDPNAEPQLRTEFHMKYTPTAYLANELQRRLRDHGFMRWTIDDLTLEVDDNWQPWYTASLNRPTLHASGEIPIKLLIANPQKLDSESDVQVYDLYTEADKIPDWVDRVYSKETVVRMVNWWGNYSNHDNPFRFTNRPSTGRVKVAGDPVLVYTKSGHPDWQLLITSLNDDTSVSGLMLFDARDNSARLYPILAGTPIESQVATTFEGIKENSARDWQPEHLSVHKIYGHITWVASYVLNRGDVSQGKAFQGLGLVEAEGGKVEGANVAYAQTKEQALSLYRQKLASTTNNAAPSENSQTKDFTGTIRKFGAQIENGETVYLIWLNEMPDQVFKANRNISIELPFMSEGDKVTLRYLDVPTNPGIPLDVAAFNDLNVPLVK